MSPISEPPSSLAVKWRSASHRALVPRLKLFTLAPQSGSGRRISTELSPFDSQELADVCREQISLEESAAKSWFERAARARSGVRALFEPSPRL